MSARVAQLARVAPAALLALVAIGCGTVPRPAFPIVDAGTALGRERETGAPVSSIRAEARVEQRGDEGRVRGTVLMFVERGERVRFDVMTQFGPVAILTSDRERFAYADLREKRYLTGATCPKNIARLLGVPLSVDETSRFLLGSTPLIDAEQRTIAWDDDGFYRVTLRAKNGARQVLHLGIYESDRARPAAEQRLYLLRSELHAPDGRTTWRVDYDEQKSVKADGRSVLLPFRVHVEQPGAGKDTLIRFQEISLNPEIPVGAFSQTPRSGMQQEEASCD